MSSVTAKKMEQKEVDRQTMTSSSSHHGDTAPYPQREQPLGSEYTHQPGSVGGQHHSEQIEANYNGDTIPVQETVVNHSRATQQLVTGVKWNKCASSCGAAVMRLSL